MITYPGDAGRRPDGQPERRTKGVPVLDREGRDGRGTGSVRVRDVSGSLTRQAMVIAAVTLVVDCLSFFFSSSSSYPVGWRCVMLVAITVVDAGLAAHRVCRGWWPSPRWPSRWGARCCFPGPVRPGPVRCPN
ncbi:hypothetical protein GCM10029978_048230 [Actinoallomurus acanthiterrae]